LMSQWAMRLSCDLGPELGPARTDDNNDR
jgi:hypothetical protein